MVHELYMGGYVMFGGGGVKVRTGYFQGSCGLDNVVGKTKVEASMAALRSKGFRELAGRRRSMIPLN